MVKRKSKAKKSSKKKSRASKRRSVKRRIKKAISSPSAKAVKAKATKIVRAPVKKLSSIKKLPDIKSTKNLIETPKGHANHLWISMKGSPGALKSASPKETMQKFMKPGKSRKCQKCGASLTGIGGFISSILGVKRSKNNDSYCRKCG